MTRNILINCLSAVSGGGVAYVRHLIPNLINEFRNLNGYRVYLLIYQSQKDLIMDKIDTNLATCIVLDMNQMSGYKRIIWESLNIKKLVNKYSIDILFYPYQIASLVNGIENVVMVTNMEPFTFHKYSYSWKAWIRNFILKIGTIRTLKKADKVISISKYVHNYLIDNNISGIEKTYMTYNGRNETYVHEPQADDIRTLHELGIDTDYIFTCGSLLPYRKCENIIEAYKMIDNPENIKLVIAGRGDEERYYKKILALISGNKNILHLGFVSQDVMKILYRNSRLFIMASETEACPNIAIEAMSSGCNILSSDVMPMPEIFDDAAVFFKHSDIHDMAKRIQYCLSSQDVMSVNRSKAIDYARRYSWSVCARETRDILKGI